MASHIRISEFPQCCAGVIIQDVYRRGELDSEARRLFTPKELKSELNRLDKECQWSYRGFTTIVLNYEQFIQYDNILRNFGFLLLFGGVMNPNTDNTVFMYCHFPSPGLTPHGLLDVFAKNSQSIREVLDIL